jgi:hypothetical protein
MRESMRVVLTTAALGAALMAAAAGCVAKNGSELQSRGTADTGTTAPATRPTNTNAATSATAGGNAAAQSAVSPGGPDSATGAPPPAPSDTTQKKHH